MPKDFSASSDTDNWLKVLDPSPKTISSIDFFWVYISIGIMCFSIYDPLMKIWFSLFFSLVLLPYFSAGCVWTGQIDNIKCVNLESLMLWPSRYILFINNLASNYTILTCSFWKKYFSVSFIATFWNDLRILRLLGWMTWNLIIKLFLQIFDGKQIPQRMVDGWNAFFFDKTEELVIFS